MGIVWKNVRTRYIMTCDAAVAVWVRNMVAQRARLRMIQAILDHEKDTNIIVRGRSSDGICAVRSRITEDSTHPQ